MGYREVFGSHLKEDSRVREKPVAEKRVFSDKNYEIRILVYPRTAPVSPFDQELVVFSVDYKTESLRLILKLFPMDARKDPESAILKAVAKFEEEEKTPYHLIRDAKDWCGIPLTELDHQYLLKADLEKS